MACCPSRSSDSLCSLFPGGTLRSSRLVAKLTYSSFREARAWMSGGNFLDVPDSYKDLVCLSAKVLITGLTVTRHVTGVKLSLDTWSSSMPAGNSINRTGTAIKKQADRPVFNAGGKSLLLFSTGTTATATWTDHADNFTRATGRPDYFHACYHLLWRRWWWRQFRGQFARPRPTCHKLYTLRHHHHIEQPDGRQRYQ